jgi:transcription elongation factor Elf1
VPAAKGPGSQAVATARAAVCGGAKASFIHEHWKPVDKIAFPGKVTDQLAALKEAGAVMQCLHCGHTRSFNPSIKFKAHLIQCKNFQNSRAF